MGKLSAATQGVRIAMGYLDPGFRIPDLVEQVRWQFTWLMWTLAWQGWGRLVVISGRRTFSEQAALFGQGRSAAQLVRFDVPSIYARPDLPEVTWCNPRDSYHVRGRAIDLDLSKYSADQYPAMGAVIRKCGFEWGGDWSVRDYGHVELK
jgi:hypothetical protein